VIIVTLGGVASVATACGGTERRPTRRALIGISPPSYRGLHLGDDVGRARGVFGAGQPYNGKSGGSDPIGADRPDFSGSITEGNPGSRQRPIALRDLGAERYVGASFQLYRGRVYSFVVIDRDAGLDARLHIGAPLANAHMRFPTLTCLDGLTYEDRTPTTSACFGRIAAHLWIWFGGDPIASIELSKYRLDA
jgi:hypothetical protein